MDKLIQQLKTLDKKKKIVIVLVVIALMGIGGVDRFLDEGGDGEGRGGKFGVEREFGDDAGEGGLGGNGGPGGDGKEGAQENVSASLMQLGIICAGMIVLGTLIQPKAIEKIKHTILGAKNKSEE